MPCRIAEIDTSNQCLIDAVAEASLTQMVVEEEYL